MTSEEQYQQLLQMDRLGVTTGKDQRLLASIAAGNISIADAFPATTPAPPSSGPGIGFGDSYTTPAEDSNAGQQGTGTVSDSTSTPTETPVTTTPTMTYEDLLSNQNFLAMLEQLGLANLASTLATGMNPYGQQQTPVNQIMSPIPMTGMMAAPQYGVAPIRRGYIPPLVVDPSSISEQTGLLQYVLNQGQ